MQVGITEIYFGKPKFPTSYLEYVGRKTTSYFPPGFLVISPLEPISIDDRIIAKEEAFSLLRNLKKENILDIIAGLSSDIYYTDKKSEKCRKINTANNKEKLIICGNRRPTKVTVPRTLGHEIGHTVGLSHEIPSRFKKVFLTLAEGSGLKPVIEFAESKGNIDFLDINNGLMIKCLDYLEKDGFSERDYKYLEDLMKSV